MSLGELMKVASEGTDYASLSEGIVSLNPEVGQAKRSSNQQIMSLMVQGYSENEAAKMLSKHGVGSVHTAGLSEAMVGDYGQIEPHPRINSQIGGGAHITKEVKKQLW